MKSAHLVTGVIYAYSRKLDGLYAEPALLLDSWLWSQGRNGNGKLKRDEFSRVPNKGDVYPYVRVGYPVIRYAGQDREEMLAAFPVPAAEDINAQAMDNLPKGFYFDLVSNKALHGTWAAYCAEQQRQREIIDADRRIVAAAQEEEQKEVAEVIEQLKSLTGVTVEFNTLRHPRRYEVSRKDMKKILAAFGENPLAQ